jgi:hypothetical protein
LHLSACTSLCFAPNASPSSLYAALCLYILASSYKSWIFHMLALRFRYLPLGKRALCSHGEAKSEG